MVQHANKHKMSESNSKFSPNQKVASGTKGKILQSFSKINKNRFRSSVAQQHHSPLCVNTHPIAPSTANLLGNAFLTPALTRTTDLGLPKKASQCSDFSVSSSRCSPSVCFHRDSVGTRIPLFATKNGYSSALQSRIPVPPESACLPNPGKSKEKELTLLEKAMPLSPKRSKTASEISDSSDVTPLPLLRRNSFNDTSYVTQPLGGESPAVVSFKENCRTTAETVVPEASPNLFSPFTNITEFTHQYTSRPTSTSTSKSTAASTRDRPTDATSKTTESELYGFSPSVSPASSLRKLRASDDMEAEPKTAAYGYRRLGILLSFLFVFIHVTVLLAVVNELSSRRCWIKHALDDPLQPASIVCSPNSPVRFVPYFVPPFVHVEVLDSNIPSPAGLVRNVRTTAIRLFFHQPVFRLMRLFKLLSMPQRISYFLRLVADQIDDDRNQLLDSTAAHKSAPAIDVLDDVKQRIGQFESSGLIENSLRDSPESRALREHSGEFKQRLEHVTENVFVAIGYGLANVVIIETSQGLILFDTLENPSNMRRVMKDWAEQRQGSHFNHVDLPLNQTTVAPPVIAIIYSHFHTDHVFGASAVYTPGVTQIWSHETTDLEISKVFVLTAGTTYKRSMRQFGSLLSEKSGYINAGIGLHLDYDASEETTAIRPTHIWRGDRKTIEIGGEHLELIHAPGESKDQSIVWMPKKQLLFGADNIYKSFPNIYAIRGTESRDAMIWVKSLDVMRELKPEFLVLGHTSVLRGEDLIYSTLTSYRDAIQFVHDQTVRYMNKGYSVDDIVQVVKLPPHLHRHAYLQQYYGTVNSAVRAVFHHYVGWFSGLAEELNPLPRRDKAAKMAQLVGGRTHLLQRSIEALENTDYQWALELVNYAEILSPSCDLTRRLKADVLRILAAAQSSTPARNWYLTAARESEEGTESCGSSSQWMSLNNYVSKFTGNNDASDSLITTTAAASSPTIRSQRICEQLKVTKSQKNQIIRNLKSAAETLEFIPIRVRAEAALNINTVVAFTFRDTETSACIHFRRGIAYSAPKCERKSDIHVYTDDETWRSILTYDLQPLVAIATGKLRIQSSNPLDYLRLKNFFALIEIDPE